MPCCEDRRAASAAGPRGSAPGPSGSAARPRPAPPAKARPRSPDERGDAVDQRLPVRRVALVQHAAHIDVGVAESPRAAACPSSASAASSMLVRRPRRAGPRGGRARSPPATGPRRAPGEVVGEEAGLGAVAAAQVDERQPGVEVRLEEGECSPAVSAGSASQKTAPGSGGASRQKLSQASVYRLSRSCPTPQDPTTASSDSVDRYRCSRRPVYFATRAGRVPVRVRTRPAARIRSADVAQRRRGSASSNQTVLPARRAARAPLPRQRAHHPQAAPELVAGPALSRAGRSWSSSATSHSRVSPAPGAARRAGRARAVPRW